MDPEVMVQIGSSPWWEKALLPIGTSFLGAGAGAYFAMLANTRLRKKEDENKNCEAAQWVLVCLFNQWHYLTRLQDMFKRAEEEISDISPEDRYLFIRQFGLDHYRLMDMRLENLSHFALHGEPGLLIEMQTCQEIITDVMTHMKNRDQAKGRIEEVISKSDMNQMEFDPPLGRAQWTRMAINDEKLERELAAYTARVTLVLETGINKHIEVIRLFREDLKKLHPGTLFLGLRPPGSSPTSRKQHP